ncbi:hypothetical protein Csa_005921 [Cucumis sativus]|uniref:Uncharacterized protein n=1 Tax=Cucumis sativus TaxID=3659 RepID=A0A0A0LKR3_CUCSA|nr:hypothetical protein Csa_005921 [Cucumis sativus]
MANEIYQYLTSNTKLQMLSQRGRSIQVQIRTEPKRKDFAMFILLKRTPTRELVKSQSTPLATISSNQEASIQFSTSQREVQKTVTRQALKLQVRPLAIIFKYQRVFKEAVAQGR